MSAALDVTLRVDEIRANPDQPRQYFDENLLDELAASMQQHGLLQPLVVRPSEPGYLLIAGERRWRAAQRAGIAELPCRVLRDLSDEQAYVLSVTENVARVDMDPIEEARAYAHIVGLGRTVAEAADLFGKTAELVQYRMDLLMLRDDIQVLTARGQLKVGSAWFISRLSPTGQADVMRRVNAGEFPTEDACWRYCSALRVREGSPSLFEDVLDLPTDEFVAARRHVQRDKIRVAWAKLEFMGAAFGPFLELDAAELAGALGSDTTLYVQRFEVLYKTMRRTASLLRQADAFHEVTKS